MVGALIPGHGSHASLVAVGVDVDRKEAARAARAELSKGIYAANEPDPLQRALSWLAEQILRLLDSASGAVPGGVFGLFVLAGLLVVAFVVIRWRLGALSRTGRPGGEAPVFEATIRTAAEHRTAAREAADGGDWDTAVREAFRGIVRDLEERTVLDERPGRTAGETARELAEVAPSLLDAARVFDEVCYGHHPATEQAYRTVATADEAVRLVKVR